MILTLGNGPLYQLSKIVDEDKNFTKELYDAVVKLYKTSNAQKIFNLEQELENLHFKDDGTGKRTPKGFMNYLEKLLRTNLQ